MESIIGKVIFLVKEIDEPKAGKLEEAQTKYYKLTCDPAQLLEVDALGKGGR